MTVGTDLTGPGSATVGAVGLGRSCHCGVGVVEAETGGTEGWMFLNFVLAWLAVFRDVL